MRRHTSPPSHARGGWRPCINLKDPLRRLLIASQPLSHVIVDSSHHYHHPLLATEMEGLFHARCTIQGKVCHLGIHEGGEHNYIARGLVDHFQLPTTRTTVTKLCFVHVSIGKHYREVLQCEVVDMDACHILLGRFWLLDHKGRRGRDGDWYSFMWDDRKFRLPYREWVKTKPNTSKVEGVASTDHQDGAAEYKEGVTSSPHDEGVAKASSSPHEDHVASRRNRMMAITKWGQPQPRHMKMLLPITRRRRPRVDDIGIHKEEPKQGAIIEIPLCI